MESEEQPVYQRIAEEAEHLRRLGFSGSKIARHIGVDDKTVAKAIRWRNIQLDSHNLVSVETGVFQYALNCWNRIP